MMLVCAIKMSPLMSCSPLRLMTANTNPTQLTPLTPTAAAAGKYKLAFTYNEPPPTLCFNTEPSLNVPAMLLKVYLPEKIIR